MAPSPTTQTIIDAVSEHGKTGGAIVVLGSLLGKIAHSMRRSARVENAVRRLEVELKELSTQAALDAVERAQEIQELRSDVTRVLSELQLARNAMSERGEQIDARLNAIDNRHNEIVAAIVGHGEKG